MVFNAAPTRMLVRVLKNSYSEQRRPRRMFFYDGNCRMIGRQSLGNRFSLVAKTMKFEWIGLKDSALRRCLKKSFFNYFKKDSQ